MVMMVPLKIALQLRNNYQQLGRLYFLFRRSKFFDFSAYNSTLYSAREQILQSPRRYMDLKTYDDTGSKPSCLYPLL